MVENETPSEALSQESDPGSCAVGKEPVRSGARIAAVVTGAVLASAAVIVGAVWAVAAIIEDESADSEMLGASEECESVLSFGMGGDAVTVQICNVPQAWWDDGNPDDLRFRGPWQDLFLFPPQYGWKDRNKPFGGGGWFEDRGRPFGGGGWFEDRGRPFEDGGCPFGGGEGRDKLFEGDGWFDRELDDLEGELGQLPDGGLEWLERMLEMLLGNYDFGDVPDGMEDLFEGLELESSEFSPDSPGARRT